MLRERTLLAETIEAAQELTRQRQTRADKSAVAVEDAEGRVKTAQREWREWVTARGLSDTLMPETADVLQGTGRAGTKPAGRREKLAAAHPGHPKDIDEYIEAVEPLATAFDVPIDRNDSRTVAAAADRLVELMDEVREGVRNRTDAEAELEDARRQLKDRKGDLRKADEELGQLLRSGGAENVENFRVRADLFDRRTKLDDNARAAHDGLLRLSGPGELLETLKSDLGKTNPESIENEINLLEAERTDVDAQRESLSTEQGEIGKELDGLISEEESSQLRMERNVLLEQLQGPRT